MSFLEACDRLHLLEMDARRTVALREADTIPGGRGEIYDIADRFRRRLDLLEADAIQIVLDEWQRIRRHIDAELARLDRLLKADDAESIRRARDALAERRQQIVRRIDAYARAVQGVILDGQRTAAGIAAEEQEALAGRQLGSRAASAGLSFDRLSPTAVEQMIGQLQRGPLTELLRGLGEMYVDQLAEELIDGMVYGRNPREVARRLAKHTDAPRWRALSIARTETMRAYREAARQSVMVNRDVVDGVTWLAKLDERTCIVCWAMHGSQHPPEYTLASHPACRCALAPRTKSWAELGIPDMDDVPSLIVDDGPAIFARQPVHVQRRVLGPARYELWRTGQASLQDMVGFRTDPRWGPSSFVRPWTDLVPTPAVA